MLTRELRWALLGHPVLAAVTRGLVTVGRALRSESQN
jgi:hypothetical protein